MVDHWELDPPTNSLPQWGLFYIFLISIYYIYFYLNDGGSNAEDNKECAAEAEFGLS